MRFSAVICHHGFKSKGWLQHCNLGTEIVQSKKSKPNQTFQAIMMFLSIFKIRVKIIEKDTSSTKPRQANGQFKICMPNGNGTSWHGCKWFCSYGSNISQLVKILPLCDLPAPAKLAKSLIVGESLSKVWFAPIFSRKIWFESEVAN